MGGRPGGDLFGSLVLDGHGQGRAAPGEGSGRWVARGSGVPAQTPSQTACGLWGGSRRCSRAAGWIGRAWVLGVGCHPYLGRRVARGGEAASDQPEISREAYLRLWHGAAGRASASGHFGSWASDAIGVGSNWVPGAQGGGLGSGEPQTCSKASLGASESVGKSWLPSGDLFPWALGVGRWVVLRRWALGPLGVGWSRAASNGPTTTKFCVKPRNSV